MFADATSAAVVFIQIPFWFLVSACRYCSHYESTQLLHELILAVGYFCVLNHDNQVIETIIVYTVGPPSINTLGLAILSFAGAMSSHYNKHLV